MEREKAISNTAFYDTFSKSVTQQSMTHLAQSMRPDLAQIAQSRTLLTQSKSTTYLAQSMTH